MTIVTIEHAQSCLSELIEHLGEGEILITENNLPVARLIAAGDVHQRRARRPGTLRGTVQYMSPDFDAPLDDFKEYMK